MSEQFTLGIDTSGAVSIAVARGNTVLVTSTDERARHHDEVLMQMIDDAMNEAGASREQITRVVAGRGPGPFTGLRVGLVTARSIATVLGAELVGISSLDALALEAAQQFPQANTIAVALDARRKEVYWGLYSAENAGEGSALSRSVRAIDGPGVAKPESVADHLKKADALVGSGAHLYPDLLPPTSDARYASAGFLILAARDAIERGEGLSSTEPLYLRDADAAKPTRKKSALGLEDRPA